MNANNRLHPVPIELVTLAYTLFTSIVILLMWQDMDSPLLRLGERGLILAGTGLVYLIYRQRPHTLTLLLRYIFAFALLGYWYQDTYEFCKLFPNLDHIFAKADMALFGCQPSISFSQWLPEKVWSELFHMGYYSYYPMIALTILSPLFTQRDLFERTGFVVLASFFLFYIIYMFLPVAGPQYYFQAVGFDVILDGHFPVLGDYFRYHTEIAPSPGPEGFFRSLVESAQSSGERPTAAFPSSHVGASTILMFLLYRNRHYLFYLALPFYFFLCCATVYIQAHYLIDVFGGFVSAVVFYYLCNLIWEKLSIRSAENAE